MTICTQDAVAPKTEEEEDVITFSINVLHCCSEVIDYGCIAYRDAARTTLTKLEVIQTQALRICSGAFRTSPAVALQVEMGEMPLHLRREQLAANYWANLQGHGRSHPTRVVMQVCWEHERVKSQSFGWVCGAIGKDLGLEGMEFSPTVPLPVRPPWLFVEPIVDLQILNSHLKSREEVDLCVKCFIII